MVNKLVRDKDGKLWRVNGVADHFTTGQRMVILSIEYTLDELLDKGCSYGAVAQWILPVDEFREHFTWEKPKCNVRGGSNEVQNKAV